MPTESADLLRDSARLAAVRATALAGTPPEEAFDRLTRLAVHLLGAPISLLSLIDGERQWVKSVAGVDGAAAEGFIPVDRSICRLVAGSGEPLCITDVGADTRVPANAAMRAWGVRAYAGVPLVTPGGQAVGALCVADTHPHEWSPEAVEVLRDLAALAVTEIEWRRSRTTHERVTAALSTAEELFRVLVEQSLVGLYVVQDDHFTYVNPRFRQIFGLPTDFLEQPPHHYLEVVDEQDHALVQENVRRRIAGEVGAVHYRLRGRRTDGELIHFEVHGVRTLLHGRPALIGVGIDVTERVRAEQEREQAILARDRFYAMMSHELRTPVSAVMLYNDLLLSGVYDALTDAQRDAVDRSQKSARHLLDLINDLLDLSKLESGRLETRVEEVEAAELVDSVVSGLAALALEHGCGLSVHMAVRPLPVVGDARRVRQILLNLLSNAIKFGHGAPVEVRCAPVEGGITVEVTDHGPGIAPADLERIFDDFVQLGEPGVGTGLGLPIARRLAELQGGSLRAESAPGRGSTFLLFLPSVAPDVAPSTGFPSFLSSVIVR
jgi:PAS domain S-box-containing protein